MAYLYNIPASTDQLSVSQGQIQGNFNALGAIAGNGNPASNSLNSGSGFNWINLPGQAANPPAGASFPAGNIGLYAGANATTGQNELYVNKTNQATVTQIAATASILSVTSSPGNAANGWTYLPSGILMIWGTDTTTIVSRNTLYTISFPGGLPTINGVFGVTAIQTFGAGPTLANLNVAISVGNVTTANFQVFARANGLPNGGPTVSIFWTAFAY